MSISIGDVSGAGSLLNTPGTANAVQGAEESSFKDILSDAINQTEEAQAANDLSSEAILTGTQDSLHTAMIDAQKAELTLQLTVQIRNKILDSYNEIMRMQV
jgi:flagellar hook-basal body complex protein FliE